MRVKKSSDDVNIWCSKKKCKDLARQPGPTRLALYLAAQGLVGEWRGSLVRHGSVLETVSYYVHTRILLRESIVIQTTVLVNFGD